ncbi:hypothetical protein FE257_009695 [Aspergillus nanangensis]|uniref:3-hydroxyisobutyrate dehydrogenase n=1 Tax=Aspergillus nanangensis TaxID=2582783 RepID=A0AAD4GSK9_ASPNN|nr:hypothetical protein FE257_009695 [Aspergillus nanangensis]
MLNPTPVSQPCPAKKVGFAGLGAMGFGMASNLLKAGFDVRGLDPGDSAREKFKAAGGFATRSTEESCKATPAQVDGLIFGADGLIQHLPRNSIGSICCTLPPTYVKSLPARLSASGRQDIRIVDSPVSGGVSGAVKGTLNIMISGDDLLAIKEIEPVLQAMAAPERLFNCGQLSNASTLKMLNQHLAGIHIVSAAEILGFAKALGLSTRETYDIVTRSTSSSWIFGDRGMHMLDADWTARSAIDIFVKDLSIVNDSADNISFPCPMASQTYYKFLESSARGHGRQDDSIVVRNYEMASGAVAEAPGMRIAQSICKSESIQPGCVVVLNPSAVDSLGFPERQFIKSLKQQSSIRETPQVYLHIYLRKNSGREALQLTDVPAGSIISVFGLRDTQAAQTFFQEVAPQYPTLTFTDCQILPGHEDSSSPEVMFSATAFEVARDVRTALLPYAPGGCHPVSAEFSSATSMFLVLRLGAIIHVAAAAECYALTLAMGVAPELVYKLVAGAAGSSAQFNKYFPHMMRAEYILKGHGGSDDSSENSLDQSLKDLIILQAMARRLKFPAVLLNAAHQQFKAARGENEGRLSIAALTQCWTVCKQEEIRRERPNHM